MIKSINPFDQTVVAEFQELSVTEIQDKLDKASKAFKHWKKSSFATRTTNMSAVSRVLIQNKNKYAHMISLEMGKIVPESIGEIEKCAKSVQYFADNAELLLADQIIKTNSQKSLVTYQPTGAVLGIMPWNFPFWQVLRFAVPAIMAGNVALLKHAANVTSCSLLLEEIFKDAGFPEGVFQSLVIDNNAIESIVSSDVVQGVALTGSEFAGSLVASIAGKQIKKTVLELGGSDPFIVLADADMELTIKNAVQSRMQNAGQSCIAAKRFIVVREIKDEFVSHFVESVQKIKQGDPFETGINMGPLARVDLAEKLEKQLQESVRAGAHLIVGGQRQSANFQPTLLDGVKPGMRAFDDETFGPMGAIIVATDELDAISIANNSRYGLGASVWTKDTERGEYVARQVEAGSVFVNAIMKSDQRLPFGGVKRSGYGRELSELGIKEFVNAKTISIG
ncbi:MAG: NAD-dependent succinate-semialdehyde dehydrogenase [Chryseolinea sp.]